MAKDRKKIVNKLDKIFSEYIRALDNHVCFTCGVNSEWDIIQCGHLITRSRQIVRWDERNAHAQCRSCNLAHEYYPEKYTLIYIQVHGENQYSELVRDSWSGKKFTLGELEEKIDYFKNKLNEIMLTNK